MKSSVLVGFLLFVAFLSPCDGGIVGKTLREIIKVNRRGSYLGVVVPNAFELAPLLQSPSFEEDPVLPFLDYGGRRFRFGTIEKKQVIIVMTGLGMLNAGTTTQLLLNLYKIKAVLHLGIAGNADPDLEIGDVTIPRYWAHLGLWNWQRYGDGVNDELSLESNGDYTRKIGFLNFSDYTNIATKTQTRTNEGNLLNSVWYQPEEIFPVTGTPEVRQHALWVPADRKYIEISKKLEGLKLERCVNATTCLPRPPKVVIVERGCSANIFVDNAAYRTFLRTKFNVTPIDMETAAVALVSLQYSTTFIAIRSLSDLAGGGSSVSNEASIYGILAAQNAATAFIKFIGLL